MEADSASSKYASKSSIVTRPRDSASRNDSGVGRMNSEFLEPCFQPWGLESGSVLTDRNFQDCAKEHRLKRADSSAELVRSPANRVRDDRRFDGVQTFSIFDRRFDISERASDRVSFVDLGGKAFEESLARGGDAHHGFIGFDLDNLLIALDLVANLRGKSDDRCFGDRFTELRHDDRNFRHRSRELVVVAEY